MPVTQARHGAGRVIHTNLDYCQSLYISFIFAVLIIANLFSITANNLIYDAEEKNGLFAATSATRVIIFAVRPFALFGRVKGKPAAFSSHNRVYTVPCSVFLCPVMCRAAFRVLSSLCLLLRFVLNCDAKVQRYLLSTKHFAKNLCLFNVLQQIKLICAVFIQILSTKLAKCAIYKANFFAFNGISTHERARTLYKD